MKKNSNKSPYLILSCLLSSTALAQVPPDAGSILREQQKPTLELPKQPPTIRVDEPARPGLQRSAVTRFVLKGLRISGNRAFTEAELLPSVQDYVGKEVGFDELDAAAARISRFYRERGYTVARAYLPAQQIKDGTVEIAVIEGRFGRINVRNTSRVRESVVRSHTDGLSGRPVIERDLERRLLLLDDLGGVDDARATLSPGANVGETDLNIEVTPAPLIDGSLELDNHGNRFTGAWRLTGRANLQSPLRLGDQLNAFYTHGFDGLEYGGLGYQLPLGGDGLKLGTAYSQGTYRLGKAFSALDSNGEFSTFSLNVSYPFIRTGRFNLSGRVSHDWRDFEDRVGALGAVTDKSSRVAVFSLLGDMRDALFRGGITVFALSYSNGDLDIETPVARAIDAATARTNGHFGKWNLSALRVQGLTERLSAYVSFSGQKADGNLDSSEKFILGGANGVRAYPQGEASGDSGWLATLELRYSFTFAPLPGVLQPFVFVDAGGVTINENPFAAIDNTHRLSGAGVGLTWVKGRDFQVRVMYATRIGSEASTASDTDRRSRGWVQVAKYF